MEVLDVTLYLPRTHTTHYQGTEPQVFATEYPKGRVEKAVG